MEAARPAFMEVIERVARRRAEGREAEAREGRGGEMRESMMIKLSELPKRSDKESGCC